MDTRAIKCPLKGHINNSSLRQSMSFKTTNFFMDPFNYASI